MYGWTKYGGNRQGLVMEELEEWFCQICGEQQEKDFPQYMLAMDETNREFVRGCTKCKYKSVTSHIVGFEELVKNLRTNDMHKWFGAIENLMSLPFTM